jgi:hypothetical protein
MLRLAAAAPIVALALALCMLAPRAAAADGLYFTESFGGTDVRDELSAHAGSAFRVRVGLGVRRKQRRSSCGGRPCSPIATRVAIVTTTTGRERSVGRPAEATARRSLRTTAAIRTRPISARGAST